MTDQPILVTGMHRSGTTWVGRMLALAPGLGYVDEPLARNNGFGVLDMHVPHWYPYLAAGRAQLYEYALKRTIAFRYSTMSALRAARSPRQFGRVGKQMATFAANRATGARPLVKDPFAVFSIPFFASELHCRTVVVVRHPAAVVGSLKRLNWPFDLRELTAQEELLDTALRPFRDDLKRAASRSDDLLLSWSMLWRVVYGAVQALGEGDHLLVRHEDLAREPLQGFSSLFGKLGLELTPKAEAAILRSADGTNPTESRIDRPRATVRLNSPAQIGSWRNRLTKNEVARIRGIVEDVSSGYYAERDWCF